MDDFTLSNLYESRNEWSARLISILTPLVVQGFNSIFEESINLCNENNENDKYLMTFQNLLSRVPKWNDAILEKEYNRIIDQSNCSYLSDLLSCVHVIQLKILTCVRAGKEQKKIDIDIPKFTTFLQNVYTNSARKIYTNIYLYEKNISPLQKQKYNREIEIIIQESIITTIRENMPIEELLKAYIDEHIEEDIEEVVSEKTYNVTEPKQDDTWKPIETQELLEKDIPSENLTVSNNITNDLPNADTSLPKAITFNESVVNNDLEESDINDTPIKITDEDVKIEFDTLESNKNDEINLDNFVQELP